MLDSMAEERYTVAMITRVALDHVTGYAPAGGLKERLATLAVAAGVRIPAGASVLVKPNMVSPRKNVLVSTTNAAFVRAVCELALDAGARPFVADSPAFGNAEAVARQNGLKQALAPLGVPLRSLGRPTPLELSFGKQIGISGDALDADLILNLPKLKVHTQMLFTGATKNLFGVVCGCRKAFAHARFGDDRDIFSRMIIEIGQALPETVHFMDGITAMHVHGPTGGEAYELGLAGVSANSFALDDACCRIIGLEPDRVPLHQEADRLHLVPQETSFPMKEPRELTVSDFVVPDKMSMLTFNPYRLAKGRVKSLFARFC